MIRSGMQKGIETLKGLRWTALAIAIAPASFFAASASGQQATTSSCNTMCISYDSDWCQYMNNVTCRGADWCGGQICCTFACSC